jgi:sulfide:quinone oxidoreductase
MSSRRAPHVLIAGGGVAGLEALLALRVLAGRLVSLQVLEPEAEFEYRPVSVAEPFGRGAARRFALDVVTQEQGAKLHRGSLAAVDPLRQRAITHDDEELEFDYLVVATGARPVTALPGAITFRGGADADAIRELLGELESGDVGSVAFALPPGTSWSLPLYELALMTATHARAHRASAAISLVTSEETPLELFGSAGGEAIGSLLSERGITLISSSRPKRIEDGALILAGGRRVAAERVVTLPRLVGPDITGLPSDDAGFIPVDAHGQVKSLPNVYAAGDATAFPIKQGGLATQQADAVAEAIAARAGAAVKPRPFRPVLRGLLLTGGTPTYMRAEPGAGSRESTVAIEAPTPPSRERGPASAASTSALWWPPSKVAGRYLAPYLATARALPLRSAPLTDRPAPGHQRPDPEGHREALDLALLLADQDARWGDYDLALRALDAAEALAGALPAEYEAKRKTWLAEAQAGSRPRAPA